MPRGYPKLTRCDCGDMTMCRWDGAGYACPACDQFVQEIHKLVDDCIVEHRRDIHPLKWDLFRRREYFREYQWRKARETTIANHAKKHFPNLLRNGPAEQPDQAQ